MTWSTVNAAMVHEKARRQQLEHHLELHRLSEDTRKVEVRNQKQPATYSARLLQTLKQVFELHPPSVVAIHK
jgi:hypothetical protein